MGFVGAVSFPLMAYADCAGTIKYASGRQLSGPADIYNISGVRIAASDADGNFSFSCTDNQVVLVRDGTNSTRAVVRNGTNNSIIFNDTPTTPTCNGKCSNCTTGEFADVQGRTGYQSRQAATCNTATCECSWETEYRCSPDYAGFTSDGQTGCYACGGFLYDINDMPLGGVNIYNIDGQLLFTSATGGEFGIDCNSGIYILVVNGLSAKAVFGDAAYIDKLPDEAPAYILSNNMKINLCESGQYLQGYFCSNGIHLQCPADTGGADVTSNPLSTRALKHACYIPTGAGASDDTGMYIYTADCHYSN